MIFDSTKFHLVFLNSLRSSNCPSMGPCTVQDWTSCINNPRPMLLCGSRSQRSKRSFPSSPCFFLATRQHPYNPATNTASCCACHLLLLCAVLAGLLWSVKPSIWGTLNLNDAAHTEEHCLNIVNMSPGPTQYWQSILETKNSSCVIIRVQCTSREKRNHFKIMLPAEKLGGSPADLFSN